MTDTSTPYRGFIIRNRHRRGYLREAGGHAVWDEVQVVGAAGRVLGRFDFDHQARAFIDARLAAVPQPLVKPPGD